MDFFHIVSSFEPGPRRRRYPAPDPGRALARVAQAIWLTLPEALSSLRVTALTMPSNRILGGEAAK